MPAIRHFDHAGITVRDLDTVTAFFAGLGSETKGQAVLEGEFPDTVIGIPNAGTEIVMLRPPGGETGLELPGFIRPDHEPGPPGPMHTEPGLRNVTFEVDDRQAIPGWLAADGYHLAGGAGQYEGSWRLASVRGPEGLLVNLAHRIS
jgi:catechol 2,3-dioxygenase-like lactoylglutathione lyase family enzyme